jgi:hypothetical protein
MIEAQMRISLQFVKGVFTNFTCTASFQQSELQCNECVVLNMMAQRNWASSPASKSFSYKQFPLYQPSGWSLAASDTYSCLSPELGTSPCESRLVLLLRHPATRVLVTSTSTTIPTFLSLRLGLTGKLVHTPLVILGWHCLAIPRDGPHTFFTVFANSSLSMRHPSLEFSWNIAVWGSCSLPRLLCSPFP